MSAVVKAEVVSAAAYFALQPQFDALQNAAAEPNVFADPRVIAAAASAGFDKNDIFAALVWDEAGALLVAWPLRRAKLWGAPILSAGFHAYMLRSMPVIKAGFENQAVAALLDCLATWPGLPRRLYSPEHAASGKTYDALGSALEQNGFSHAITSQRARGALRTRAEGSKGFLETVFSSEKRKKLRQSYRRLEEQGALEYQVSSGAQAIEALQQFLSLEQSGWKGQNGTAMASSPHDRVFIESLVQNLAAFEQVFISQLSLKNKMIAAGLILRAVGHVWFLKIAYDERFKAHSPGVHYANALVQSLLDDPGFVIADSGAPLHGGAHVALCTAPLPVTSQLILLQKRFDMPFALAVCLETLKQKLKHVLKVLLRR